MIKMYSATDVRITGFILHNDKYDGSLYRACTSNDRNLLVFSSNLPSSLLVMGVNATRSAYGIDPGSALYLNYIK